MYAKDPATLNVICLSQHLEDYMGPLLSRMDIDPLSLLVQGLLFLSLFRRLP